MFGGGWFVLLQSTAKKICIIGTVPEAEKKMLFASRHSSD